MTNPLVGGIAKAVAGGAFERLCGIFAAARNGASRKNLTRNINGEWRNSRAHKVVQLNGCWYVLDAAGLHTIASFARAEALPSANPPTRPWT